MPEEEALFMFSMSCTLVLYRAVKPASLPLLHSTFVLLPHNAVFLINLYKARRRDSSDCNNQTHPRRACLPPVVSCTGACNFHCFGQGQWFLHCLPFGRCLCAMRLLFPRLQLHRHLQRCPSFSCVPAWGIKLDK